MGILKSAFLTISLLSILSSTVSFAGAADQSSKLTGSKVDTIREFAEQKLRDEYEFEASESFKDCIFLAHELGWSNGEILQLLTTIDTEPVRKEGSLVQPGSKSNCVRHLVLYSLPFLKVESIADLSAIARLLRFFTHNAPNLQQASLNRLAEEAQAIEPSSEAEVAIQIKGLMGVAQCYPQHVPELRAKMVGLFNHCLQLSDKLQPPDSDLKTSLISEILSSYDSNNSLTEREFSILKSTYEKARKLTSQGIQLPRGNLAQTFQILTRNCDSKVVSELVEEFRSSGSPGSSPEIAVPIDIYAAWTKTQAGDIVGAEACFRQAEQKSAEAASYDTQLQDYANIARLAWKQKTNQGDQTLQEIEAFIAKLTGATTSPSIYEPAAVGLLGRCYMSKGDWMRAKDTLERSNKLFAKYQHKIEDRGLDQSKYLIDILGGDAVPDQFSVPEDLEVVYAKLGTPQPAVVHASEPYKLERKFARINRQTRSYYPMTLIGLSEKAASKVVDDRIAYLLKALPLGTDPASEYIWLASLCAEQGFFAKAESCFDLAAKNESKLDFSVKSRLNLARLELCITKGDYAKARETLNSWLNPEEFTVKDRMADATNLESLRQVKEFFKGRVEIAAGDLRQGCAILSAAIPRWTPNTEYESYYLLAVCDLGDAYASLGKTDEAKATYERALSLHRERLVGGGVYRLLVELALVRLALLQVTQNQGEQADRTIFDARSNGEEPHSGLPAARLQESAGLVYAARSHNVRAGRLLQDALENYQLLLPENDSRLTRCRDEFAKVSASIKNEGGSFNNKTHQHSAPLSPHRSLPVCRDPSRR